MEDKKICTDDLGVIADLVAKATNANKALIYAYASGMADQRALSELEKAGAETEAEAGDEHAAAG